MRRRHGNRARLGGALLAALGALALLGAGRSLAAARDGNHDHISDRWEKRHHLSLHVNQARRDQDRDHLDNLGEFRAGDNPRDADTDNDGVTDGNENAGTISSFDMESGKLTITLFGAETVSGLVTEDTRIRCGHESDRGQGESGEGSEASSSSDGEDNSGPANQGDDENEDSTGHDGPPSGAGGGSADGEDNAPNCSTEALVVGATVSEAELQLVNGDATFEKIELAP